MPVCLGIVEALAGQRCDSAAADCGHDAVAPAGGKLLTKPADYAPAARLARRRAPERGSFRPPGR